MQKKNINNKYNKNKSIIHQDSYKQYPNISYTIREHK